MNKETIIRIALAVLCAALLALNMRQCNTARTSESLGKENLEALRDSVSYWKDRAGDLVAEKKLLVGNVEDLRSLYGELDRQLSEMKIKNAAQALQIRGLVDNPPVRTVVRIDTVYPGVRFAAPFDCSDKWRTLKGTASFDESALTVDVAENRIFFAYTAAVKDNKVYIKSDNPYVAFDDVVGITSQDTKPRKKRWSFGVQAGIGVQYGLFGKGFDIGPQIGCGLNYNF